MWTILFADDSRSICEFCRCELEEAGYCVSVAGNTEEAVRLLKQEPFDVAVFDIGLPPSNGLELAEKAKKIDPSLPVIFFTSNPSECLHDPRTCQAVACIQKSDDLTELKQTIGAALATRQSRTTRAQG